MLDILFAAPDAAEVIEIPAVWNWLGGPVIGAAVATGVLGIIRVVTEKKMTPTKDIQEKTQILLNGLESMVTLMTEDKAKDAERMNRLQIRIDELEDSNVSDFGIVTGMQDEIKTLKNEILRKDTIIRVLVIELDKLGLKVNGADSSYSHGITFEEKTNG